MCEVRLQISEGMSGVLLEAMSLGVPVLARNNAGNATIIEHGRTGLLFGTPGEFVVLARALVEGEQ